jgi:hypothetical protein
MALRISQTGVRTGEFITCAPGQKQCQGTVIQLRGEYPPSAPWIVQLSPEQIRDRFNNYRFFRRLTVEQRIQWLNTHAVPNEDLYMEDVPGLYIKFVKIGGTFIMKALTQDQINMLLAGNPNDPEGYWLLTDVYNLFPRKPGSRAKKHTLIFRPSNWALMEDTETVPETYNGLAVHLESGSVLNGQFNRDDYPGFFVIKSSEALRRYTPNVAVIASTRGTDLNYARLERICGELGLNTELMKQIYGLLEWASPSVHKSLVQKILRTRCTHVEWVGTEYPAREVFVTSFCMLLVHPGAFVPNIQRFVSGMESALKRLAVAICEDAYLENNAIITSLLAGAWIAQNVEKGEWYPSDDLLKIWITYGLFSLEYPYMFDYDWHEIGDTFTIPEWNSLYMSYYLLASVQSFDSDVKMVASIAYRQGRPTTFIDTRTKRVMPLVHCIDQHSFTDIGHYVPYDLVRQLGSYSELFKQIWNRVVGINPRKPEYANFNFVTGSSPASGINDDFFNTIRTAQTLIWISRIYPPQPLPVTGQFINLEYTLDPSWLASFVGSVEIRVGHHTAIVMINPDDLLDFSAIKRPSRDKSPAELTEEEKTSVIETFKQSLRQGRPFVNVPSTLPMFQGGMVYLTENDTEYMVRFNNQVMNWNDAILIRLRFPVHAGIPESHMYTALTMTGDGIRENGMTLFNNYLTQLPLRILQRSMIYLGYSTEIDLHHIGRDGKGVDYAVTVEDTGVNYLLATIASIFPAALVKNKTKYTVKNGPLMWMLTKMISDRITALTPVGTTVWPKPAPELRPLWEHQIDAINNLMETKNRKKARIIWLNVGLGKTAIIGNYISRQIEAGTMSRYCLYTLPPSAIATVEKEFNLLKIPFVHLDMRASSKTSKELIPGVVNVVYHDHLRMMDLERVKQIAPEMMFIVDEFHKTLNATIRTSTALEIAHLADDVIAMTGTLIKDTHIEPIIAWLSMATNFEVTLKNYWVALASIIAGKVQTRVVVERLPMEASLNDDERRRYYEVVPANLGGTAHKINFRNALEISYEAISREIIKMTMFHINAGLGVFVVARNIAHQQYLQQQLYQRGVQNIFLIGKDHAINLTPTDPPPGVPVPQVVITTPSYSEGYNLTRYMVMITGVYLTNITVQQQLEGRINRINQISPSVRIVIIHAGILSYIHRHHEAARRLAEAIKGFAKEVGIDQQDLRGIN